MSSVYMVNLATFVLHMALVHLTLLSVGVCEIPHNAKWVNTTQGFRMAVYQSGDIVSDSIARFGAWENNVEHVLGPFMKVRDTIFVDIGANIGWHSFVMSKTFRVVAFEPFEANRALIKATTCESNRQMDLRPYALANETSMCTLHQIPSINFGDTVTACTEQSRAALVAAGYKRLGKTSTFKLDDVAGDELLKASKVVKMDVEGHEYKVITGGEKFFSGPSRPLAVYAEVNQLGDDKNAFFEKMRAWGYRTSTRIESKDDALFVRNRRTRGGIGAI